MLGDARLFTDQLTDVPFSIFFPHGVSATASGIDFLRAHFSFLTEQMFLQDCSISSDTVHDPTDTVQADTLAHMLNK